MRNNIIFIFIWAISAFAGTSIQAQVDTAEIAKISQFARYIDLLADNDEGQTLVIKSIAEGRISQEIVTTSKIGHSNKTDTTRTTKSGGFGRYTTENLKGDTVYKILYHDNIDKNFYETYYFKDNKLVYAKIDYQEDGIGKTFYFREEYYSNGKPAWINETAQSIDAHFRQRVSFDLLKKGNEYLKDFMAHRE